MKQITACVMLMASCCLAGLAQSAPVAHITDVKSVYILPMARGMDQYLAHSLTKQKVVQVVTDPAKAEAVLTDHLGASFEASLKDLYPEAKPLPPAKPDEDAGKDAGKDQKAEPAKPEDGAMRVSGGGATVMPAPGRNRGMVFLVARGSSEVLWSAYHDPSARKPKELNRAAGRLSSDLKRAMKPALPQTPADK